MPALQRDAWIHGAVTLTAQSVASLDTGSARCVMSWYFDYPETHGKILKIMELYSDTRASGTLFGMAKQACESLGDQPPTE